MGTDRDLLHVDTYEYPRVPLDNSNRFSGYKKGMSMVARILLGKSSTHLLPLLHEAHPRQFLSQTGKDTMRQATADGCCSGSVYHFLRDCWHRFLTTAQSGIGFITLTDHDLTVKES